jgi:hypothetical protein
MGLRIGTWNVQYGKGTEKNRRRRDLLVQRDADVWILTETNDQLDLSDAFLPVHSADRYSSAAGGRWVSIWTRLPVLDLHPTEDRWRTVAATVDGGPCGALIIYGTVLPWQHDIGPDSLAPAPGWSEFYRVTPSQGAEWSGLRASNKNATLIVAGDLNHNLGGPQYYGTTRGRTALREALQSADLTCLTESERFQPGQLAYPPIDHVCAAPPEGHRIDSAVEGWNKSTADGTVLSDHSGVLADIQIL